MEISLAQLLGFSQGNTPFDLLIMIILYFGEFQMMEIQFLIYRKFDKSHKLKTFSNKIMVIKNV